MKSQKIQKRKSRFWILCFIYTSFLIVNLSCKNADSHASKAQGYVQDGQRTLWSTPANIPVCWENLPTSDNPFAQNNLRTAKLLQETVVQVYQELGFIFTGWGTCAPGSMGIRIAIKSEVPRVEHYGARIDGVANGMILNFMDPSCRRTNRELCLKSQAVHEFGHALGLNHEMNRPDSTCRYNQASGEGEAGAIAVGDYDAVSVMDYCYIQKQMAQGLSAHELSAGDKETLRKLYSGEIVLRDLTEFDICQDMHRQWLGLEGCCETFGESIPGVSLPICLSPQQRCQQHSGEWKDSGDQSCCEGAKPFNELGQTLYQNYQNCSPQKKRGF